MDLLLAYGRKIRQSTDLESERNLRVKRERMEISLQFAKLAVNVLNAKFIYIADGDFSFTSGEVIEELLRQNILCQPQKRFVCV